MDSYIALFATLGLVASLGVIGCLVEGERPSKPRLPKRFWRTVGRRR